MDEQILRSQFVTTFARSLKMYRQEEYLYNSTVATAESFVCNFSVATGKIGSNFINYFQNQCASNAFQYVVARLRK
ncbi:MAG: hypothetical protein J6T70_14730 [Bacteroidales bacterium]|nr:hypothetical protein [Bacteroidales bacterium]